jgi:CBS-domain-containing membrane protein
VGLAVAVMLAARVTHPPAGAVPLVAMASPEVAPMLFVTLLLSAVTLVGLAMAMHRLPPRVAYPKGLPGMASQGAGRVLG